MSGDAYQENTLNGEISTTSVYISVNNNTNFSFFRFFLSIIYGMDSAKILSKATVPLKVHKHEFFIYFFCRNRNLMVPRACNTRFLKIVFDSAEIFDF